ncbi:hypothetical protein JOF42_003263 [Microbacterium phyllosphaerae]|uniref:Uncharacterized protein n=1 Tax=Microbacterium phyllosphaerae TaxID=124798 RepID=A0ABS4WU86_9MICO|nr:hypothetical protein [Microbacterium phyllosphaerae]MBP2379768.1 hypothetical protein [Microbacterium phyllosphaerae]
MDASALEDEAHEFAVQLMLRLSEILPTGHLGFTADASPELDGSARIAIASVFAGGIPLTIDQRPALQLEVDYKLMMSPTSKRATVVGSTFLVRPFEVGRPLFTVDYVRNAHSNTPAAHYNLHFEHGSIEAELLKTGASRRGKIHQKGVKSGKPPRLADLHFPTGGHRFRLCLEDVIEMLWIEFGIDVKSTAKAAICEGRERWRVMQVRAAVADDPQPAAEELRALGYVVEDPKSLRPRRLDRIHAI